MFLFQSTDKPSGVQFLTHANLVATSIQGLIRTTRSVVAESRAIDPVDRARRVESTSKKHTHSVALWRTELNLSLATQHLCQLTEMLVFDNKFTNRGDTTTDQASVVKPLILSRERLLAAVRQVALAGAQLLLATKLRKPDMVSSEIRKLKVCVKF